MGLGVKMWVALVLSLSLVGSMESQLSAGFYGSTCSLAEFVVKDEVRKAFIRDKGIAAGLVRLHFHDCFVRGCDGSVLIDSTPSNTAEKDSPANGPSLRGLEVIDSAKARLETICKGVVSCADILAFAARDSVEVTGGFGYDVPAGRRDGRVSVASETVDLPPPSLGVDQLTQTFAKKGLTQEEMVTLSGAHTIGRSHCASFTSRLYGSNATTGQDPSLDANYAAQLKQQCPQGRTDPKTVIPMNPTSPNMMDNGYYVDILSNRGLFASDQALLTNQVTGRQVSQNAANGILWKTRFAAAMAKMGQIGVLTGTAGEIRTHCRKIN
ncbi:peroxidase 5-like [Aristolochia californica]|uniref:peroxidase 5-like n=1 Tax=Aristolochia californica TaxID=171875 RepID=UPI0035E338D4